MAAAYNERVLAFLRQPNVMELMKERSPSMWSKTQLKNKITLIRSEGIQGLERFANDVDLITLLRYHNEHFRLRCLLLSCTYWAIFGLFVLFRLFSDCYYVSNGHFGKSCQIVITSSALRPQSIRQFPPLAAFCQTVYALNYQ